MVCKEDFDALYPHRGARFRFYWPLSHYLVTNFCVTIGFIYFRILNRTTVIGKKNVPKTSNTLLLSNHQTMIDSFLVGLCAYYPRSLIYPSLIPWNPAAAENFYRTPVLAWLADNWKCIRVKQGRRDATVLYKMKRALSCGPLTLFPEGTRSRSGEIGKGRAGAGFVILENSPTVIPVCIDGVQKILPIGAKFPRFFRRIYVYYGRPVDLSEFADREKNKENAQAVIDKVMAEIKALQKEIKEMRRDT